MELIFVIMLLLIAFRETLPQIFEAGKAAIATFTVDVGALGIVLANIRKWFGDTVADGIEPFFQAFMYGGWGGLASLIGQRLLQVLGAAWAGITSFLAQKWSEIDWNAVFASMGAFAASAATWIGNLWASIDWNAVLSATGSFADALGGFLLEQWNRIDWGAIGKGAGSGFRDFMILQISTALDALDLGGIMTKKTAGIDWLTLGLNVGMGSNDFVTGLVSSFFDAKAWEPLMNKLNEKGREGGMAFLRGMVDLYTFGSLGKYQTLVDLLRHALDLPEPNGSTGGSGGFVPTPTSLSMMPGAGRPQAPITVEVNIESITGEADENRLVTKVIAALRAAQQEVLGTPPPTPQLAGTFV